MKRSMLVCALFLAGAVGAGAQTNQSSQYQGVSNPPPDDQITTPIPQPQPMAKPSPAHPLVAQPAPASEAPASSEAAADSDDSADSGVVQVEPQSSQVPQPAQATQPLPASEPSLTARSSYSGDPDGDIVHPAPLPPGELNEGTIIRARLLNGLSTTSSQAGDTFRAKIASDVFRGNEILIPQGAEIDGTVVRVSTGHFGGHGSMLLRPEFVILPDGSRFRLYAQVTGTPGSNTNVGAEGKITPGSRVEKDGIEYGGAAGAGAVTGAVVAGPAGALAGSLVGAGAVTVHLLMDHPQATLKSGTVLDFALTEPLNLVAADHATQSVSQPQPPAAAQPAPAGQQQIPDIE